MKPYLITLLYLLTFYVFGQKKNQWKAVFQYHQIYTTKQKARMDSLMKNDAFYRQMQGFANQNIHNKTYVMFFDNKVSKFYQKYIDKDPNASEFLNRKNSYLYLFKSYQRHQYIQDYEVLRVPFTVVDSLSDFHWKITGEQKKIGQYKVIKATGYEIRPILKKGKIKEIKLNLIAWFCPDIPIPNGPELYGGLPGFIMELNTGKDLFLLKELSRNPKKNATIKPPEIHKQKGSFKSFLIERQKIYERFKKYHQNHRKTTKNWWQN